MEETIRSAQDVAKLRDNYFFGSIPKGIENVSIIFKGSGNILYCEEGVSLAKGCAFLFNSSNSVISLRKSKYSYNLKATVYNGCTLSIGRDNYFNGFINIIVSEECIVLIGDEGLYSFAIWVRTADPHLIYDAATYKRINPSKNVILGDHVWVGQDALILKGSTVGSGSIIGAKSVVSGKTIPSNEAWGGNPARLIRSDIFWDGASVHAYTEKQSASSQILVTDKYLFSSSSQTLALEDVYQALSARNTPRKRLETIKSVLSSDSLSNRFFVDGN